MNKTGHKDTLKVLRRSKEMDEELLAAGQWKHGKEISTIFSSCFLEQKPLKIYWTFSSYFYFFCY